MLAISNLEKRVDRREMQPNLTLPKDYMIKSKLILKLILWLSAVVNKQRLYQLLVLEVQRLREPFLSISIQKCNHCRTKL